MQVIHHFFGVISNTLLFGFLPLDIVLHYLVGLCITILLLKKLKNNLILAFFILLSLAIAKEIFDSFSLTATWMESIKDLSVTMIHPFMLFIIRKWRKNSITGSQGYFR
ncbi:MAG: hypothetical protein COW00_19395 [Bdellovibrio sp. CG12_big_fil_rev_8_21_14_0_65_39_13]|nr:MAG: hypothetical protein COW78_01465 [Bdellovibrio sp. CG22_combo_CG10-13_8_21_14_all_39_27]PIQ57726.1 MAG: hypothetical protein COW00_19395 [Bdellovibrio sp. CG12_big_fil_rev_8_21_14_0_65_39_13]PIR36544.1 MAG: hypothetical protein COV37_02570 [Bdellovibrio sp. CG11_big_fil_rev_8_21_14_0_20_39_38]